MLLGYLRAAMRHARYEILEDDTFYGEIPGFQGVFANADNLEDCRQQLQEVLEDWLVTPAGGTSLWSREISSCSSPIPIVATLARDY